MDNYKHIIGSNTKKVSHEVKGDLLTQFDIDKYHVIHYLDGTKKMTLISSERPSVMLKHVEKVFNDWDLLLNVVAMNKTHKSPLSFSDKLIFGDSWITVYMNNIHKDMISDDAFGKWYKYKDGYLDIDNKMVKLEEWLAQHIIMQSRKYPSDKQLQRIVKLKSLLK